MNGYKIMSPKYPHDSVIVSVAAVASDDPSEVVDSNVSVVNAQFDEHLTSDEIAIDSLRSYYVDYFLAQFHNGGFSQFVYNSRWGACIDYVIDGFAAIGAHRHAALFDEASRRMAERPGIEGLKRFFESEYFGENAERDVLDEFNGRFRDLEEAENLVELNAAWLRGLPHLVALTDAEIVDEIRERAEGIADRDARIAKARAAEPRYMKLIRSLCVAAGHELDRVTAGDPSNVYGGRAILAWHFLTDRGHYHMIDFDGQAIMFEGFTKEIVRQMDAGPEFGDA